MGGKGSGAPAKRSEERTRRNTPAAGEVYKLAPATAATAGIEMQPVPPEPGAKWPDEVVSLYKSLRTSPSVMFMYQADWEMAWHLMEQFARHLLPQFVGMSDEWNSEAQRMEHLPVRERVPMNGATMNALLTQLKALGVTEEGRRRMSFEAPPLDVGPGFEGPAEDGDDGVVHSIAEARAASLA